MGNNFSSKYELFRNVKADDKKGLNRNYGIFLVLRRKTGFEILIDIMCNRRFDSGRYIKYNDKRYLQRYCISLSCFEPMVFRIFFNQKFRRIMNSTNSIAKVCEKYTIQKFVSGRKGRGEEGCWS